MHQLNKPNSFLIIFSALLCAACSGPEDKAILGTTTQGVPTIRQVVDSRSEKYLQEMATTEHFSGVALVMKSGKLVRGR